MDCSPPGSSIHGIFQARVLQWVAMSFSRGSSWVRVSYIAGRHFTVWATREAWVTSRHTQNDPLLWEKHHSALPLGFPGRWPVPHANSFLENSCSWYLCIPRGNTGSQADTYFIPPPHPADVQELRHTFVAHLSKSTGPHGMHLWPHLPLTLPWFPFSPFSRVYHSYHCITCMSKKVPFQDRRDYRSKKKSNEEQEWELTCTYL